MRNIPRDLIVHHRIAVYDKCIVCKIGAVKGGSYSYTDVDVNSFARFEISGNISMISGLEVVFSRMTNDSQYKVITPHVKAVISPGNTLLTRRAGIKNLLRVSFKVSNTGKRAWYMIKMSTRSKLNEKIFAPY